jgi:amidase
MTDPAFLPATELARRIRDREIGSRELLEHYLARAERYNPRLNAIIVTDLEKARRRADEADAALKRGESWGPLHGVPMTVKESFDVAGLPTTWGLAQYKDKPAASDALAVARFRAAGAIVFGKTNVPAYLADWQSFNPVYGTTNNPWDVTRVPGGSSGGSAAALAAGLTGLEAGSDIGASIRNPAHYCGVYGIKPTWGICSPRGHALGGTVAQTDISAIGPLARSADDLDLALGIMAGPDTVDGAGWKVELPAPKKQRLGEFRVALMLDDPNSEVDREVQDILQRLADALAKKGVTVSDKARPRIDTGEAQRTYIHLLRAATSGRQTTAEFEANRAKAGSLGDDDNTYLGRMLRGMTTSHRDWLAANEKRHKMRLEWARFFEEWDLLLSPIAASAAFPHDHEGERHERTILVNGKKVPTTDQLFWAGFSCMVYLPGAVAPAGLTPAGLPVGVQIVGPQYHDRTCIHFARLLEREWRAFTPPPGYE